MHQQADAIQMGTHNICLYKEVDKNYSGCNLKTTELLDCALIGACVVIRSNAVCDKNTTILKVRGLFVINLMNYQKIIILAAIGNRLFG